MRLFVIVIAFFFSGFTGLVFAEPVKIPKGEVELPSPVVDQLFSLDHAFMDEHYVNLIQTVYKVNKKEAKTIIGNITKQTAGWDFPTKRDVLAVIAIESSFNCKARSSSSIGCMQVNAKAWNKKDTYLLNVENNVSEGTRILRQYYDQQGGDLRKTLLAYNVGPTALRRGEYNEEYWKNFQREYARFEW